MLLLKWHNWQPLISVCIVSEDVLNPVIYCSDQHTIVKSFAWARDFFS